MRSVKPARFGELIGLGSPVSQLLGHMHVPCLLVEENTGEQFSTTAVDDKSGESNVVVGGMLERCKGSPDIRNVFIEGDIVMANDD
jgi:hypothetical protein